MKSILAICILLVSTTLHSEVITDPAKIEEVRESIAMNWDRHRPEDGTREVFYLPSGEQMNTYDAEVCHYIYSNALFTHMYSASDDEWLTTRNFINYELGPRTTANEETCNDNANGEDIMSGISFFMSAHFMLFLDRIDNDDDDDEYITDFGDFERLDLHKVVPLKLETDIWNNYGVYKVTFDVEATPDIYFKQTFGINKSLKGEKFLGIITFTIATNISPVGMVWHMTTEGMLGDNYIRQEVPKILSINGQGIPLLF